MGKKFFYPPPFHTGFLSAVEELWYTKFLTVSLRKISNRRLSIETDFPEKERK